jgi:predicted PurR-regulated permease PerM/ActR/RegA family two-component response regulator
MISPSDILHGKVLIVDNEEASVLLLERMLSGAGYTSIASTMDPSEVCELHRKNRYDLILLDLHMPGMDGFQVMESLKAIEKDGRLPVLVITSQPDHKLRALQAGAKDFVSKPFDVAEVLMRVHNILEVRLLRETARCHGVRPAPAGEAVPFELAPRTIAWIVAALGGLWLIYRLWVVGLLLVVALVFAGTFNPIIEWMEARGHKRTNALILLILALGLGAALLIFLTVPALIDQLTMIVHDLPGQREALIGALDQHRLTAPLGHVLNNVGLEQTFARLQTYLVGYWSAAVGVIGFGATTFFLSFYLLADGKRTQGALYAVVPRHYHMRLARIIHNLETIVGGYLRGQLITSVALGAFTFLLLVACGVRNALALALFAALMDVIPFVGGILATGPAVLIALGRGPSTAVVVLVGLFVYQQFENKVLVPRVYGHVLRLSPVTVVLALIAGGILLGVMGALLALPIAAGLQMIIQELRVDLPGDDSDDPTERARDQKTEAAYELMSAGSTAPDAGQIANELAHGIRQADAWVAASQARKKAP